MGTATFKSPWVSVETMDVRQLFGKTASDRLDWYRAKLCPYRNQLLESATGNKVPPQLIATVILNELGDINSADVIQDAVNSVSGSVGPAQMQVSTAIEFFNVDVPSRIQAKGDGDVKSYVSDRLQIMQVAIEAAAREIRRLLELMSVNKTCSWQVQHGFWPPSVSNMFTSDVRDLYYQEGQILGTTPAKRFAFLCEMVIAAYNSPDIVIAKSPGDSLLISPSSAATTYMNGRIHGYNGSFIGSEVYDAGLFR